MSSLLPLDPDELLTTTRAVRKRLDLDRPVPVDLLTACVEIATQAPTGSNRQGWHFVLVTDPATRNALADLYRSGFADYLAAGGPASAPTGDAARDAANARVRDSAVYLADNLHRVPAFLIPCIYGRLEGLPSAAVAGLTGSLWPAVWSFCLAARARGLGTVITTLHLPHERESAELLGIPFDKVTQMGLIPVAYTKGTDFKPAPRRSLDDVLHVERW